MHKRKIFNWIDNFLRKKMIFIFIICYHKMLYEDEFESIIEDIISEHIEYNEDVDDILLMT